MNTHFVDDGSVFKKCLIRGDSSHSQMYLSFSGAVSAFLAAASQPWAGQEKVGLADVSWARVERMNRIRFLHVSGPAAIGREQRR